MFVMYHSDGSQWPAKQQNTMDGWMDGWTLLQYVFLVLWMMSLFHLRALWSIVVVGYWHGCLSWGEVQMCIWPSWCHCHLLSLAPENADWFYLAGFTFLVPAHPGGPRQNSEGCKTVVVVVVVVVDNDQVIIVGLHWGQRMLSMTALLLLLNSKASKLILLLLLLLQPFYGSLDFVHDCPGEPVPER